jgi:hypothetical protein
MDIFNNSKGFSIEAFPSSHLWNPYHGFENIKQRMMFKKKTLAEVAGEETAQKVYTILTNNGVNEKYAKQIKPWAAMFSVASKSKYTGPIIDHKLLDMASIQNKEIYQIESPEEMLAAFYAMPMESQVSLLKDKLKSFDKMEKTLDEMIEAYLVEDLVSLTNISTNFISKDPKKKFHRDMYFKHSINIRNVVMAHYMNMPFLYGLDKFKGQGGTFVSVGAMHLPGKKGVLNLLEKNYGYKISRIEFK